MKKNITGFVLLAFMGGLAGCAVEDEGSVYIAKMMAGAISDKCVVTKKDEILSSGTAYVSGMSGAYLAAFYIQSNMANLERKETGDTPSYNDFIMDSVVFSYTSPGFTLDNVRVLNSGVITPSGALFGAFNLLAPQVLEALANYSATEGAQNPVTVLVGIKVEGKFRSGKAYTAPEYYFPLEVFTNLTCEPPAIFGPSKDAPCGNPQDGHVECAAPAATP